MEQAEHQVDLYRKTEKFAREVGVVMVIIAVAASALAVFLSIQASNRILNIVKHNEQLASQNRSILERVNDCTTVGGTCYNESQQRSADLVRKIVLRLDCANEENIREAFKNDPLVILPPTREECLPA